MRLLIAPGVYPPDSGGPATFVPQIASALSERGHVIRVVTNGTALEGYDEGKQFSVVRIPRADNIVRRYSRQIKTLVKEIRSFQPDLVLSNAFDLQAVTAAKIVGVPVATKVVGDNAWERARRGGGVSDTIDTFQDSRYGPKIEFFRLLRTLQTRGADHVIVPSNYLKSLVSAWGVTKSDVSVVYNAIQIDPPVVPDANRTQRIVTVGRLVSWKGIGDLITALERTADNYPDAELHIVGDGPRRRSLKRQAERASAADRIRFHGRLEYNRVLDLMAQSRVFALNSTYEGLPHVVLEAMACGTPVVASAVGGTPETITDGESGFLVEQGDIEVFSDRFGRLLGDPELRQSVRSNATELLETKFDHESMVSKYERLFRRLSSDR